MSPLSQRVAMANKLFASCFIAVLMSLVIAAPALAKKSAADKTTIDYAALSLHSHQAMVVDQESGTVLYNKNPDAKKPIASITKLMMAMVVLDAKQSFDVKIGIKKADIDTLRKSRSRLKVGTVSTRGELLHLALMSSENRAASALARNYPGGTAAFIAAMNKKAKALGMSNTRFRDSTGLDGENISTARDLVKLVQAGFKYPTIRQFTTSASHDLNHGTLLKYKNSNPLFKDKNWQIDLSKTGYIKPAGHCLVMQTRLTERPIIIVLLDAPQRNLVSEDSKRIKSWLAAAAKNKTLSATASAADLTLF